MSTIYNPGRKLIGTVICSIAMFGILSATVFVHTGLGTECICETKCEEGTINDQYPVCKKDTTFYQKTKKTEDFSIGEVTEDVDKDRVDQTNAISGSITESEPEGSLMPDGNVNLIDDYDYAGESGKQFIAFTTRSDNYFYLIIDRDDNGNETIRFLNQVDGSDLLSLVGRDGVGKYTSEKAKEEDDKEMSITAASTENTSSIVKLVKTGGTETKEKKKVKVSADSLILMILAGFGAISTYICKKTGKKDRKDDRPDPDTDHGEGEEEDYLNESEGGEDQTGLENATNSKDRGDFKQQEA